MKVFEFCYNPDIHESHQVTVSIHRTKEGAERAMRVHRERVKRDLDGQFDEPDCEYPWDYAKSWSVVESPLLP